MSKWSNIILKTFIICLLTAGLSLQLLSSGPKEDAEKAAKERLASQAAQGEKVIPFPVPPFTISPECSATEPYIDRFIPEERHGPLGPKLILQLRYEGGEDLEALMPRWVDYCGYDFAYRLNRPFGTSPAWDYFPPVVERKLKSRPEYTLDQTYRSRIGGMRRMDVFGPDEIGHELSRYKVLDSDGPGNNEYENNMISKKYGLRRTIYLPRVDMLQFCPFLEQWEKEYLDLYGEKLDSLKRVLRGWPEFRGKKPLDDPEIIYLLFLSGDMEPLEYFLCGVERDYRAVASKFKDQFGFNLPMQEMLINPRECAQRIKFWLWVKSEYGKAIRKKAELVREKIPRGLLVGNIHFECWLDYERLAEAYDWAGTSVRPTLLPRDDDLGRLYWMGYGTRLFNDLTDKAHMISVRSNTLGGGPRVVPSAAALTYWHNQAIQNGCVGFYIWVNEFPAYPGAYGGICYGNPDKSTLPKIRWNTHMRVSKQLGQTKVFNPPKAKTVTLVSQATCALNELGGWKRVFSSYIELCRAKVWNGFVSDQEIWEDSESLEQYKIIYIPSMIFEKEIVIKKILDYVKEGGTLICGDPRVFSYNLKGEDISHYREELFGVRDIEERIEVAKEVKLEGDFSGISIHPYSPGYILNPVKEVKVMGRYKDKSAAVTLNNYGKGEAYLFGVPILDIYSSDIRTFQEIEKQEDRSRLIFYKRVEELNQIEDQSWIWDITVYNLHNVTGWVPYRPMEVDESIQFEKAPEPEHKVLR
jgi:hypothetical protein